jgi:DNA-binding IclR family transcriptional regulator
VSAAHLTEVVAEAERRGWASEVEENEAGIACVGVALVRPGGRSLAVSVTGPIERMDASRREEVGALLREQLATLAPAGFTVAEIG